MLYTCREMSRLVSRSQEERPGLLTRIRMRFHWMMCKWCSRYRDQIHFLHRCCRGLGPDPGESAPGISPEARERIRRKLREHQS